MATLENNLKNLPCGQSCLIDSKRLQTPRKLSHVGVHQQVAQHEGLESFFHKKNQKICELLLFWTEWSYHDQREIVQSISLKKACLRRANGGKAQTLRSSHWCWKVSSFQHIGFRMGETQIRSFVFSLEVNRSTWGRLNFLQMLLNTQGRRDHSIGRIWSAQLSRSARMFFFPRMYLAMMLTMCSSDQAMATWASPYVSRDTIFPCFLRYATTVVLLLFKTKISLMILCRKTFKGIIA